MHIDDDPEMGTVVRRVTALFAAGVPQSHVELIVGHAGQGMSAGKYRDGEKVPLRVLYEAICKLDWSAISPMFVPAYCSAAISAAEGTPPRDDTVPAPDGAQQVRPT